MVNKVFLIGNLGKEVELRNTQSGKSVAKLSVATTENYTKDGNKEETTEWHNVIVWGSQAESCAQYLVKGQKVYVEGKIQTRSYDKEGAKVYVTEIVAQRVQFLEKPKGASSEKQATTQASFDDIPF